VSYRLIDHEPEGRTDKVRAMRGHSVAEARLPLLAPNGHAEAMDTCPLLGDERTSLRRWRGLKFDPKRTMGLRVGRNEYWPYLGSPGAGVAGQSLFRATHN
jgi:hypothetical protein